MQAIIKNEIRKLKMPATNPMIGGPAKKPRKPILETAAKAIPGDICFDLPASLYTNGTTEETPKPTIKKPIMEVIKPGKITAMSNPVVINDPLNCTVFLNPNRPFTQSAINRPVAIVLIKAV